jgi:hypothetical protein
MKKVLLSLFLCSQIFSNAQSFDLIPLGVHGGGEENNLSSYLIGETGKIHFCAWMPEL